MEIPYDMLPSSPEESPSMSLLSTEKDKEYFLDLLCMLHKRFPECDAQSLIQENFELYHHKTSIDPNALLSFHQLEALASFEYFKTPENLCSEDRSIEIQSGYEADNEGDSLVVQSQSKDDVCESQSNGTKSKNTFSPKEEKGVANKISDSALSESHDQFVEVETQAQPIEIREDLISAEEGSDYDSEEESTVDPQNEEEALDLLKNLKLFDMTCNDELSSDSSFEDLDDMESVEISMDEFDEDDSYHENMMIMVNLYDSDNEDCVFYYDYYPSPSPTAKMLQDLKMMIVPDTPYSIRREAYREAKYVEDSACCLGIFFGRM